MHWLVNSKLCRAFFANNAILQRMAQNLWRTKLCGFFSGPRDIYYINELLCRAIVGCCHDDECQHVAQLNSSAECNQLLLLSPGVADATPWCTPRRWWRRCLINENDLCALYSKILSSTRPSIVYGLKSLSIFKVMRQIHEITMQFVNLLLS